MSQSFHQTGGWIEVIAGVMFSGKSEELIRRVRRSIIARKRVQVFKSRLDERYSGIYTVSTHDGRTVEAIPADSSTQISQQIDPMANVIAIDEAQFLDLLQLRLQRLVGVHRETGRRDLELRAGLERLLQVVTE